MRTYRMWTLALAALIATTVPTPAADEKTKPVPEEGAIEVVLLRHKSVRDDLKLTHREARKIHEFTEKQWEKAQKVEELSDAKERDEKYAEMTKEDDRFLEETLTPAQLKRSIRSPSRLPDSSGSSGPRSRGAQADRRTEEEGGRYQAEAHKEYEELLHSTTRRDRHAELRKLHESCKKRLLDLLTDEQETKYHEMIGHPFHGELRFDEPPLVDEKSEK